MGEKKIVLVDLPCSVKGFVRKNEDESFTIVINSRLSYEQQTAIYKHEVAHIMNGDFDYTGETKTADEIEKITHGLIKKNKKEEKHECTQKR